MKLYIPNMTAISALKETELAYMGGFFDGEGCIHVYMNGNKLTCKVSAAQNRPEIPKWFHDVFGGSFHVIKRNGETYKEAHGRIHANGFEWGLNGVTGPICFMHIMLPWLRIKKPEAQEALAIMENRNTITKAVYTEYKDNVRNLRTHAVVEM